MKNETDFEQKYKKIFFKLLNLLSSYSFDYYIFACIKVLGKDGEHTCWKIRRGNKSEIVYRIITIRILI